ncbi:hypothetical protein GCM10027185_39600 [Spirosoma pulveris]
MGIELVTYQGKSLLNSTVYCNSAKIDLLHPRLVYIIIEKWCLFYNDFSRKV